MCPGPYITQPEDSTGIKDMVMRKRNLSSEDVSKQVYMLVLSACTIRPPLHTLCSSTIRTPCSLQAAPLKLLPVPFTILDVP